MESSCRDVRRSSARGDPCRVPVSLLHLPRVFRRCLSNQPTWHTSGTLATVFRTTMKEFSSVVSTGTVSRAKTCLPHVGTWFDMFCEWWLSRSDALVHLLLFSAEKWTTQFSASRHGRSGGRKRQSGMESATSWYTAAFWSTTLAVLVSCTSFSFLFLSWGCREHSVSGC